MSRGVLLADVAIAVVVGALLLLLSPGFAITGVIALVVLVVCGISLVWSTARTRRRRKRIDQWR